MNITGEYQISCDRRKVWDGLNDPELLQKCIPGCEALQTDGTNRLHATIVATIGPVKSRFATRISLENLDPPNGYTLTGEGKAGAAGFGRGSADVRLRDKDGGTLLSYDANFQVGGKLAQVGSRLVLGATRKLADDFFGNFSRELDPEARRSYAVDGTPGVTPGISARTWVLVVLAVAALLIWWFLLR